MSDPTPALAVRGLSKTFVSGDSRVEVLRDASLGLDRGESAAITGPSGSGKSTLLHLIGTLDEPTSGSISIAGENPFERSESDLAYFRNRELGFVFQENHLLPQYTVEENVLLPSLAFPSPPGDVAGRARELLGRVGLGHRLEHKAARLSGGERQRAAVARALILEPKILLCDEPTGNLDRDNAEAVADLLLELHREAATVLVVVTHDLELAARFDRRFELDGGILTEV